MAHPWQHLGGTVFPWASLGVAARGWAFPSLVLSFRLPRLAGLWIAGPLVGGALLPSLADPAKIRVSTYCEKRARSGIITGEMTHRHKHTVRIFADVGGFYYSSGSLDTRGRAFPTVSACVRYLRDSNALRDVPFTHYIRGGRIRPLWGKVAK